MSLLHEDGGSSVSSGSGSSDDSEENGSIDVSKVSSNDSSGNNPKAKDYLPVNNPIATADTPATLTTKSTQPLPQSQSIKAKNEQPSQTRNEEAKSSPKGTSKGKEVDKGTPKPETDKGTAKGKEIATNTSKPETDKGTSKGKEIEKSPSKPEIDKSPSRTKDRNHEDDFLIYGTYLSNILKVGRITEGEDKAIKALRKKLNISKEEHVKIMNKLGWTPERYNDVLRISEYVAFLESIVKQHNVGNSPLVKEELHVLEEMRGRLKITDEMHKEALKVLNWSPKQWNELIKESYKDEKFGKVGRAVHVYNEEAFESENIKKEYLRGLFVLPRLHQWVEYDENCKEPILWLDGRERTASSTELFYDLIFVTVISKLTHLLASHHEHWFSFVVLYTSIWRVWITNSGYSSRFDTDDLAHKLFYYSQMVGVIAMGLYCEHAYLDDGSQGFSISFIVANLPVIFMYIWASFVEKRTKTPRVSIILLLISLIPWIISSMIKRDYFFYWCAGLLFQEIGFLLFTLIVIHVPKYTGHAWHDYHSPVDVQHWADRLGLLIIIVLGEAIVALFTDSSSFGLSISVSGFVASCLGLLVAFSLKWIYFDIQGQPKLQHALQREIHFGEFWTTLHWPLSMAIAASAAGMIEMQHYIYGASGDSGHGSPSPATHETSLTPSNETALIELNGTHLNETLSLHETEIPVYAEWLFSSSLGIALFCIAIHGILSLEHRTTIVPHPIRIIVRLVVSFFIIVIPTFVHDPLSLLAIVASLLFGIVLWEMIALLPKREHYNPHAKNEEIDSPPEDEEAGSVPMKSISTFLKQERIKAGRMKDGTLVMDAVMKDGTLVFEPQHIPKTRKIATLIHSYPNPDSNFVQ
eukprot:TRINITY_DN498_c0_g1_i1.p1 TRINITY_DN498_c0_g1~~TRINITY_DN498_c0_g1_i1.p1  ORF type:complete len:865 (+),score=159.22 TRINITY_DN498_c0_g1_i1:1693-4287(+)